MRGAGGPGSPAGAHRPARARGCRPAPPPLPAPPLPGCRQRARCLGGLAGRGAGSARRCAAGSRGLFPQILPLPSVQIDRSPRKTKYGGRKLSASAGRRECVMKPCKFISVCNQEHADTFIRAESCEEPFISLKCCSRMTPKSPPASWMH